MSPGEFEFCRFIKKNKTSLLYFKYFKLFSNTEFSSYTFRIKDIKQIDFILNTSPVIHQFKLMITVHLNRQSRVHERSKNLKNACGTFGMSYPQHISSMIYRTVFHRIKTNFKII